MREGKKTKGGLLKPPPDRIGLKKLSTSNNSVLRRLLGICKPYSASKMFVSRGISHLYIGLHNEMSTVQIVLLVLHYYL